MGPFFYFFSFFYAGYEKFTTLDKHSKHTCSGVQKSITDLEKKPILLLRGLGFFVGGFFLCFLDKFISESVELWIV